MSRKKPEGWKNKRPGDPKRHAMSARGIPNAPVKPKMGPKVLKTFPSSSSDRTYEVRLAEDGIVYCTCPAWKFQKGKDKEERACKHMRMMGLRGDSMMTGKKVSAKKPAKKVVDKETARALDDGKSWWYDSDSKEMRRLKRIGIAKWLQKRNESELSYWKSNDIKRVPTLYVENAAQAILFDMELKGQISDGIWENDPRHYRAARFGFSGYEPSAFAVVKISAKNPRFVNAGSAYKYNFHRVFDDVKESGDYGHPGRMLRYVRESVDPNYTYADLRRDVGHLRKIHNSMRA